ncbi:hypothetical protein E2562_026109 [Oryza meyeriana var. granulata]|uniref:Uncharacterized protein n=1 Tax=Oryza meyeriana var. granulata TaxID=110450 RepID=A0A6G1C0V1_9ORYZ|nr:hypothetical protein E2562_026109 [Oryza meyeriana var. granulata]
MSNHTRSSLSGDQSDAGADLNDDVAIDHDDLNAETDLDDTCANLAGADLNNADIDDFNPMDIYTMDDFVAESMILDY